LPGHWGSCRTLARCSPDNRRTGRRTAGGEGVGALLVPFPVIVPFNRSATVSIPLFSSSVALVITLSSPLCVIASLSRLPNWAYTEVTVPIDSKPGIAMNASHENQILWDMTDLSE
jgi:hypothetical protein